MEATQMFIDRWMDKEAVVCIYDGILRSHKKEHMWASSEMDEPTAYSTQWSKPESKKNKYHMLMHICGI